MSCDPRRLASVREAARDVFGIASRARVLVGVYGGSLEGDLRERVMVAVSQVNACRACTGVHRRWALRAGVGPDELEDLRVGDVDGLDARNRAAVTYAVARAEQRFAAAVSPGLRQATRKHLTTCELEAVEAVARVMAFANLSLNTLAALHFRLGGGAQHPVFARVWARLASRVGSDEQRAEMLAGLRGRVVEVGAGDGRNFALYPPEVTEVLAIEPEPYLRRLAERAARRAPVPVQVLDGTAESLPLGDASCEAVVSSLLLCSVADQRTALAEMLRVLAPGGELRFFEHVVARGRTGTAMQSVLDRSGLWPRLGAGCHLARDTVRTIGESGFTVGEVRRFSSGPGSTGVPFVLGSARVAAKPS
ncbi:MAG: hypothetical protein NVSMB25_12200 [Thermoleophilaceae bacterium]